jgi:hypothetical protein
VPVQVGDIIILATDGLSDNLWDEDVLEEVTRFRPFIVPPLRGGSGVVDQVLRRRTSLGLLSQALCFRAKRVAERRNEPVRYGRLEDEVPFARRAREHGRPFHGGKNDGECYIICVSHLMV